MSIGAGEVGQHVDGFGNLIADLGEALGCPSLPGATAHVGFDECKEPFTNYFLCDGTADDEQLNLSRAYVDGLGEGSILMAPGDYDITEAITLTSGIFYEWVGSGIGATRLNVADGADCNVFEYTGATRVQWPMFRNFSIYGNKDNNASGSGFHFIPGGEDIIDGRIENVFIFNIKDLGINISTSWGWIVDKCVVQGAGDTGISMSGGAAELLNTKVEDTEGAQAVFFSAENGLVNGCQIQNNEQTGLRLNNVVGAKATDNWFFNNGTSNPGAFAQILVGSVTDLCIITGNDFDGQGVTGLGINVGWAGAQNTTIRNNKYLDHTVNPVQDNGTGTLLSKRTGTFPLSNVGGGASAVAPVINTSPGGVDIDDNDEFTHVRIPIPVGAYQVLRIKIWGYSNVIEATNNMLLRLVAHGAGSSELWDGNAVDVADKESEEEGSIVQYDVIHWIFDASDDAQIGTLAAQDLVELLAIGEAASAPDIATDALIAGYEIEYV